MLTIHLLVLQQMWHSYPKHVSFIVGNEFCERFSYYGMRCKYWLSNKVIFLSNLHSAALLDKKS